MNWAPIERAEFFPIFAPATAAGNRLAAEPLTELLPVVTLYKDDFNHFCGGALLLYQ